MTPKQRDSLVTGILQSRLRENVRALDDEIAEAPAFNLAVEMVRGCLEKDGKLLLCGNGGSGSAAAHIVNDFLGHMYYDRPSMPAICLSDNVATLTALAIDVGYDRVYGRQVEGLGNPGDVLLAFSTSGNSPNVLFAAEAAKAKGMAVIGLTAMGGGKLATLADVWLRAYTTELVCAEHVHLILVHTLTECVEALLFGDCPRWGARPRSER